MNVTFTKDTPVYQHSAAHAREHQELPLYRESYRANIACKEAIEKTIHANYANNCLDVQAVLAAVSEDFSMDRIKYVLVNTIQQKDWDGRISGDNKVWAQSVPIADKKDAWGSDRNCYFVVDQAHTGLVDLFATHFRKELAKEPQARKPSVLEKLQKPLTEAAAVPGKPKAQEL